MRALAMTGIETASTIESIMSGSDIRATPPSRRMSAGTRSSAMTATAPASSAIRACSGSTTSMMTPPLSMSARPRLTRVVPVRMVDSWALAAGTAVSLMWCSSGDGGGRPQGTARVPGLRGGSRAVRRPRAGSVRDRRQGVRKVQPGPSRLERERRTVGSQQLDRRGRGRLAVARLEALAVAQHERRRVREHHVGLRAGAAVAVGGTEVVERVDDHDVVGADLAGSCRTEGLPVLLPPVHTGIGLVGPGRPERARHGDRDGRPGVRAPLEVLRAGQRSVRNLLVEDPRQAVEGLGAALADALDGGGDVEVE